MVSLSDNCLGGERDRVYNSARVCVWEERVLYRVFWCGIYVDVNLLARHVLGALFMGFYKEKCYFCLGSTIRWGRVERKGARQQWSE